MFNNVTLTIHKKIAFRISILKLTIFTMIYSITTCVYSDILVYILHSSDLFIRNAEKKELYNNQIYGMSSSPSDVHIRKPKITYV